MARIISASIDLAKVDKTRIIKGKKGQLFYPLKITVNDEANQYDQDVAIQDQLSKEERESGTKAAFIGNGKTVWTNNNQIKQPAATHQPQEEYKSKPFNEGEDDLPF